MPRVTYKDIKLEKNDFNEVQSYTNEVAAMFAVRNLLLSHEGCWPFLPKMGINIAKYEFEFANQQTLTRIQKEVKRQIAEYLPTLDNVTVTCRYEDTDSPIKKALNIYISGFLTGANKEIELMYMFDATTTNGNRRIRVLSAEVGERYKTAFNTVES